MKIKELLKNWPETNDDSNFILADVEISAKTKIHIKTERDAVRLDHRTPGSGPTVAEMRHRLQKTNRGPKTKKRRLP